MITLCCQHLVGHLGPSFITDHCCYQKTTALSYGVKISAVSKLFQFVWNSDWVTAAGPLLWNSLPLHLRDCELSLLEFHRLLDMHLFVWRSQRLDIARSLNVLNYLLTWSRKWSHRSSKNITSSDIKTLTLTGWLSDMRSYQVHLVPSWLEARCDMVRQRHVSCSVHALQPVSYDDHQLIPASTCHTCKWQLLTWSGDY